MAEQGELLKIEVPPQPMPIPAPAGIPARARLKEIDRAQSFWGEIDIDTLVAPDHIARAIWHVAGRLKLDGFLETNKSVEGRAGRERLDPRLLVSVWVYGYSQGIGSARELERQMEYEPGLRWLTGMEAINHHTLSDFRVLYGSAVEELFGELLGLLSKEGLIDLERVAHDGTKIEAVASGSSRRREKTLREHIAKATEVIEALEREESSGQLTKRKQAARRRAAEERIAGLERAVEELEEVRKSARSKQDREQARVSLTEPEARVMKHGDGGYGPSYNVQTTTETKNKILVGIELSQQASDQAELEPALDRFERQFQRLPGQMLVDGGYTRQENIVAARERGVELIGPVPDLEQRQERNQNSSLKAAGIAPEFGSNAFVILEEGSKLLCPAGKVLKRTSSNAKQDVYRANRKDCEACPHQPQCCPKSGARSVKIGKVSEVMEDYRERMQQEENREIFKLRGPTAEFPHAWIKEKMGLRKFHVRGLAKARVEALWVAVTYNIQQWVRLSWRPQVTAAAA